MNFMKWRWLYGLISLALLVPSVLSLVLFRFKPSIDFTGGALLEIKLIEVSEDKSLAADQIKETLKEVYTVDVVQQSGPNQVILKGKQLDNSAKNLVLNVLSDSYGQVEELRFETVGPTLGRELLIKTLIGITIASIVILSYVWLQFHELKYGISAVLAMFHDTLILLGSFSLLGHFFGVEVDVLFVTAVLTTLSFSVHDTVVVYDRIRELRRRHPKMQLVMLINTAVTETLSRSINNSITIIIMLATLALLGGESIRWFVVALLIGAVVGTYSSTFTAAPLLLLFESQFFRRKKH
jgi:preprotein translocase subunit SecF